MDREELIDIHLVEKGSKDSPDKGHNLCEETEGTKGPVVFGRVINLSQFALVPGKQVQFAQDDLYFKTEALHPRTPSVLEKLGWLVTICFGKL